MRRVSNGTILCGCEPHMAHHDVPNVCPLWAAYYLLAVGGRRGWWRVRKKARERRDTRAVGVRRFGAGAPRLNVFWRPDGIW